ncbi:hypothetical protein MHBO_004064 [Bonamia ostreae]|uniref:Uncharacterized protein n=1 Tax=Bonamia ostreae TaxID=126728 RepID=A0ABV2ASA8_9EUKA
MTEEEAREKALNDFIEATETAQQSSYVENLSAIQRERGAMRMFTSYMSSPIMYQQKLMSASRNIANGRGSAYDVKRFLMFAITQPLMYQLAQTGFSVFGDDDEDRLLKTLGKGALLGTLQGLPIASKGLEYIYTSVVDKENWNPYTKRFEPIPNLRIIPEPLMLAGKASNEFAKNGLSTKFYDHMFTLATTATASFGIPLRNLKKITYDNFMRATGNLEVEDWREILGYTKTQLGLKG